MRLLFVQEPCTNTKKYRYPYISGRKISDLQYCMTQITVRANVLVVEEVLSMAACCKSSSGWHLCVAQLQHYTASQLS